jgi:hypothetical protein
MKRRGWIALALTALSLALLGACAELEKLGIVDPASAKDHVEPHKTPIPGSYYPSWPALDGGTPPQAKGGTSDPFLWDRDSALGMAQPTDPLSAEPPPNEDSAPSLDLNDGTITRHGTRADVPAEATPAVP